MYACPWCGSHYLAFQTNCNNCGGPLSDIPDQPASVAAVEALPEVPPAPRAISDRYVWKLLSSDAKFVIGFVFGLLGSIFAPLGLILTVFVVTAFVGIPFLLLGLVFLGLGGYFFWASYQKAQKTVWVLREGLPTEGQITQVDEDYSTTINNRHPWIIGYEYRVDGQAYSGQVSTLTPPRQMEVGHLARILYLASEPQFSSIYPHP